MSEIFAEIKNCDGNTIKNIENSLKLHGEQYIAQIIMYELVKSHEWLFVVSNRALYKFSRKKTQTPPRKRVELLDIHSVVHDMNDKRTFDVYTYKSKTRLGINKIAGAFGLARMNFDSFLQHRRYRCSSDEQCTQIVYILKTCIRNLWQRSVETSIVLSPEIYQTHINVIKLRGYKSQDRLLILSTAWLYNLEVKRPFVQLRRAQLRWAVPVSVIVNVAIVDKFCLKMSINVEEAKKILDDEHLGSKGYHLNAEHFFVMRSEHEIMYFVYELSRLILNECGRRLNIEQINSNFTLEL